MMNATQLATRMLEWETTQRAADAIKAEIEAAVLEVGKTQTVGNVRATFSAGRRTFDYETAVYNAITAGAQDFAALLPFEHLKTDYAAAVESAVERGILSNAFLVEFTETVIDYPAAAKGLNLEAPVKSQSEPTVTLKLLA